MQYLKFGVIGLLALFIVLTGLSLLFPADLRVSRVINVTAPQARTAAVVADLRTWKEWNGFFRSPALTHKRLSSPATGRGAWLASDQLTVRETAADSTGIDLLWELKGGKRYTGGINLLSVNPDSLTVQWWFDLHFRWYPWEKLGAFVYDRKLGPVMEESLDSLRAYLEKSR
jgi:hypothetical protein